MHSSDAEADSKIEGRLAPIEYRALEAQKRFEAEVVSFPGVTRTFSLKDVNFS